MSATKYRIRSVADFAKVPASKRGECMADFIYWLALVDQGAELNAKLGELLDVPAGTVFLGTGEFVWVDDDRRGVVDIEIVGYDGVEVPA